ncbi:hypothetical protein ACFVUY_09445 [Kitasatospora sp. NPDC058063]|uniref:hypothetical protein n=1 Tax=unclassified Kitasatospora TaxID=2633591 RepID=UPI0036DD19A1
MPGTRHFGGGRTRRAARWLAVALLLPALTACGGGGGGGGSGSAGAPQAGQTGQNSASGQPDDQRTKDEGDQGSFRNAGEPSANVQGSDRTARISLSFPSSTTTDFTAVISKVSDCGSTEYATPASQQVQVINGQSERVEFQLPPWKPGTESRNICLTVTADNSTKRIEAVGSVIISNPGAGASTGNGGTNGSTPTGGSSPYTGAPTGTGSTY